MRADGLTETFCLREPDAYDGFDQIGQGAQALPGQTNQPEDVQLLRPGVRERLLVRQDLTLHGIGLPIIRATTVV